MDVKTAHRILLRCDDLEKQQEDDQRCMVMLTAEVKARDEELKAAQAEAQEANENAVNFMMENEGVKAELRRASNEKARVANDHALGLMVEGQRLCVENGRLGEENVRLRAVRQRTDREKGLVERSMEIVRRLIAHLLGSRGIGLGGLPGVRDLNDWEHMIEAVEHALNDKGVVGVTRDGQ